MTEPIKLDGLNLGMGVQPKKQDSKGVKAKAVAARNKAKAKTAKVNKEVNKPAERVRDGAGVQLKALEEVAKGATNDATTREGRLLILHKIAEGDRGQEAIRAIKELEELEAAAMDESDRIDPAAVCAYLVRAQLFGEDPGQYLINQQGLYKVARAVCLSLGLDSVALVLGDNTGDYSNSAQ